MDIVGEKKNYKNHYHVEKILHFLKKEFEEQ